MLKTRVLTPTECLHLGRALMHARAQMEDSLKFYEEAGSQVLVDDQRERMETTKDVAEILLAIPRVEISVLA